MRHAYAQLTRIRALSFGGQGHVQTFDIALGHDIQRDGDTVVVRKGDEVIHFPWEAVEYAVPVAYPVDIQVVSDPYCPPDKAWLIGHDAFTPGPAGLVSIAFQKPAMVTHTFDGTPEPSQAHAKGNDHAAEKGKLEEGARGKHSNRDRGR